MFSYVLSNENNTILKILIFLTKANSSLLYKYLNLKMKFIDKGNCEAKTQFCDMQNFDGI